VNRFTSPFFPAIARFEHLMPFEDSEEPLLFGAYTEVFADKSALALVNECTLSEQLGATRL